MVRSGQLCAASILLSTFSFDVIWLDMLPVRTMRWTLIITPRGWRLSDAVVGNLFGLSFSGHCSMIPLSKDEIDKRIGLVCITFTCLKAALWFRREISLHADWFCSIAVKPSLYMWNIFDGWKSLTTITSNLCVNAAIFHFLNSCRRRMRRHSETLLKYLTAK